jgi:hypothetical protein
LDRIKHGGAKMRQAGSTRKARVIVAYSNTTQAHAGNGPWGVGREGGREGGSVGDN